MLLMTTCMAQDQDLICVLPKTFISSTRHPCLHMSVPPSFLSSLSSTSAPQITLPINKHCDDPQNEEFGSVAKQPLLHSSQGHRAAFASVLCHVGNCTLSFHGSASAVSQILPRLSELDFGNIGCPSISVAEALPLCLSVQPLCPLPSHDPFVNQLPAFLHGHLGTHFIVRRLTCQLQALQTEFHQQLPFPFLHQFVLTQLPSARHIGRWLLLLPWFHPHQFQFPAPFAAPPSPCTSAAFTVTHTSHLSRRRHVLASLLFQASSACSKSHSDVHCNSRRCSHNSLHIAPSTPLTAMLLPPRRFPTNFPRSMPQFCRRFHCMEFVPSGCSRSIIPVVPCFLLKTPTYGSSISVRSISTCRRGFAPDH